MCSDVKTWTTVKYCLYAELTAIILYFITLNKQQEETVVDYVSRASLIN
jgi:hypothetical protein